MAQGQRGALGRRPVEYDVVGFGDDVNGGVGGADVIVGDVIVNSFFVIGKCDVIIVVVIGSIAFFGNVSAFGRTLETSDTAVAAAFGASGVEDLGLGGAVEGDDEGIVAFIVAV